jgi:hypothetical protein
MNQKWFKALLSKRGSKMRHDSTRITIEISEDQKNQLKILAALSKMTLKDLILDRTIGAEPNKETIQAFSDYKNKVGLTKHDNFGDFWKDINK